MKTQNTQAGKMAFASAFFFLIFSSLQAQKSPSATQSGGGGGLTIGIGFMDVAKLHEFVPAGVKEFKKQHLLIGGEGHGITGRFVIGAGGFGMIGDDISTDSFKYSLGGGMGTFDLGYLLVDRKKLKVYPLLGIGGGGYGLQIARNGNIPARDLAADPGQEININKGGLVFDLSLNLNFIPVLNFDENDNSYGGFMTGLKVGYIYGVSSSNWQFTAGDITGGPDFGLNMAYVKLVIGGFGFQKGN